MELGDKSFARIKLECGCILLTNFTPVIYKESGARFILNLGETSILTSINCPSHKKNP